MCVTAATASPQRGYPCYLTLPYDVQGTRERERERERESLEGVILAGARLSTPPNQGEAPTLGANRGPLIALIALGKLSSLGSKQTKEMEIEWKSESSPGPPFRD